MGRTTRVLASMSLMLSITPLTANAWKSPPAGVIAIAEARERADTGDYMVLEGVVVESRDSRIFEIADDTGKMIVLIPEHVIRREGEPEPHERIRVAGKYDRKKLDTSVEGLRVMTLWRGETVTGGSGPGYGERDTTPATPRQSSPPAAAAGTAASDSQKMYRPTASPEMVAKLSLARQEWLAAIAELEEASTEYARALYAAGDSGTIEPKIEARNQAAEDRVNRVNKQIPGLVDEARRAGVSEAVLRLYVQMTTRHP